MRGTRGGPYASSVRVRKLSGLSGSSCRAFASSSHKWPPRSRRIARQPYGCTVVVGYMHARPICLGGLAMTSPWPSRLARRDGSATVVSSGLRGRGARRSGTAPRVGTCDMDHHHGACLYRMYCHMTCTCTVLRLYFAYPYLCLIYAPAVRIGIPDRSRIGRIRDGGSDRMARHGTTVNSTPAPQLRAARCVEYRR